MTIYDIAAEAGVSASTVSRVINNKSGVRTQTRELVESLLKKYNYSPDEAARGLVNKNTKMIGILVSDIRNQHYTDGAYIIEQELLDKGYCSLIFNTGGDDEKKARYVRLLAQRKVEGAVFIGSNFATEEVRNAVKTYLAGIPIVMANGSLDLDNVYSVLADDEGGVSGIVRYLYDQGRQRIVYLDGEDTPSNKLKRKGYESAIAALGLNSECYIAEESSFDGGLRAMSQMLDNGPCPDGVICAVDVIAIGALRAAADRGIAIPSAMSVIGIDNLPYAAYSNPRLSSLDNHLLDLSVCCARTLIDAFSGKPVVRKILIPSDLVIRES